MIEPVVVPGVKPTPDLISPTNILPRTETPEVEVAPGEGIAAAFNTENPVVGALKLLTRPAFEPDPAFRIGEVGPKSPLWLSHSRQLSRALSQKEFQHISRTIEQEQRDRRVLASQGVGGLLTAMGAGILSPTSLIPLVGPARGVAGMAQALALAAAASTADEVVLFESQETRTAAEAGFGIAAGTILGGLLGSGAVLLRDRQLARLEASLKPGPEAPGPMMTFAPDGRVLRDEDVELTVQRPSSLLSAQESKTFRAAKTQAEAKAVLPKPAEGFVRMYHGGQEADSGGPRWFTSDPIYARDFRNETGDKEVWYVDVPRNDPMFTAEYADQTVDQGFTVAKEFDPAGYGKAERLVPSAVVEESAAKAQLVGGSIGAKATREAQTPFITELQPDGTMKIINLVDPNETPQLGSIAPATMLGRVLAWINPPLRSILQPDMPTGVISREARRSMQTLTDAGVEMEGARQGVTVGEGTVEARLTYWDAVLARSFVIIRKAYDDYVFAGETPTVPQRAKLWAQVTAGQAPAGKLSFTDFQAELTRASSVGDKSDIPEVNAAAGELRKIFFGEFDKAATEAADQHGGRPLYKFIETEEDASYMRRDWDSVAISADRLGFINLVADYYETVIEKAFAKRAEKIRKALYKNTTLAKVLTMERAEAEALLETVEADIKVMRTDRVESATEVEIDQLRQQRKDLYQKAFEKLEEKNVQQFPETTAGNKRLAREAVKEEQRLLTEKIEALEESIPEATVKERDELRRLKKLATGIRNSMGGLAIKQEKALAQITENEDLNIKALTRLISSVNSTVKKLDKLTDAELNKELAKIDRAIARLEKTTAKGEEEIIRLQSSALFDPDRTQEWGEAQLKQFENELRLDTKENLLWERLSFDREKAREELLGKIEAAKRYTDAVNSRRAVRNEKLRLEVKEKLSPETAAQRAASLRQKSEDLEFRFSEEIREAGGITEGGPFTKINFRDAAEELATKIADKITGNSPRLASIDLMEDTAVGLRSPMKRRLLNIPYDDAAPFLNKNYSEVLAKYAYTMGADIELYRATGDRTGSVLLQRVNDDMNLIERQLTTRTKDAEGKPITEKRRTKDLRMLEVARRRRARELEATLDRIRQLRGVPADPANVSYRLGRGFINLNTSTMMGSALLSSIPDAARVVFAHGLRTAYKDSWEPLIASFRDEAAKNYTKEMIAQLELFGIGTDVLTQRHSREWFDMRTYNSRQTKLESGLEYLAHKTPTIAGFAQWSDWQKKITGIATMARVLRSVEALASGKISMEEVQYLGKIGISPDWARRIAAENRATGTPYKDFFIPNSGEWKDWQALRVFQAAMGRENDRLVITPGLEKPLWMDQHIVGRVVGQFRSFTMATNSKMVIAGLQERNMAAYHTLSGATLSLALGAVSYYTWAMTNSARSREEMRNASWETWLDQALYRSGLLGALSEAQALGAKIPLTRPYVTFADSEVSGRRAESIAGQILGPSYTKLNDILGVVAGIDDPTQSTVNQARKIIPWNNVFYLKEGFAALAQGTGDFFNLPDRREAQ